MWISRWLHLYSNKPTFSKVESARQARPSPPPGGLTALTHLGVLQFRSISPGPLNVSSQRQLAQSGGTRIPGRAVREEPHQWGPCGSYWVRDVLWLLTHIPLQGCEVGLIPLTPFYRQEEKGVRSPTSNDEGEVWALAGWWPALGVHHNILLPAPEWCAFPFT